MFQLLERHASNAAQRERRNEHCREIRYFRFRSIRLIQKAAPARTLAKQQWTESSLRTNQNRIEKKRTKRKKKERKKKENKTKTKENKRK